MDVSTLAAGPAQAGIQPPAAKPGIGFTPGAGASPGGGPAGAAGESGFASLVALALDQMDGTSSDGGEMAGTSGRAPRPGQLADDVPEAASDDASPLDAPVDAATLSVLIALATPVAAPPAAPQPEVVSQATGEAAALASDVTGIDVSAPAIDAEPGTAPSRAAATASTAFDDVLATAVTHSTAPAPAVPAASAPAATDAAAPELTAPTTSPELVAVPAGASPAAPARPPTASAAAPEPGATAAPAPAAAPRAGERPAVHPLRQALAAMAAAPADAPSAGDSPSATTAAEPRTAAAAVSAAASASASAPAVSAAGHDGRGTTVARAEVAAPAFAVGFSSESDTNATADGSTDGSHGGGAAAMAFPARGLEPSGFGARVDGPAFAAPAEAAAAAITTPHPSLAAFGASGDTMLRALDVPAAARFEQTLSSVDPDVRNLQAMVRTVRLFTAGGGASEARLTLEPEHLGPVALTVRVEQGSVSAHFRADTPAAQRWIETHQQELRSGLREQGLEVKELVVTTDPDGRRDRRQDAQPARPPRARRPQGTDAPRFEVLV